MTTLKSSKNGNKVSDSAMSAPQKRAKSYLNPVKQALFRILKDERLDCLPDFKESVLKQILELERMQGGHPLCK